MFQLSYGLASSSRNVWNDVQVQSSLILFLLLNIDVLFIYLFGHKLLKSLFFMFERGVNIWNKMKATYKIKPIHTVKFQAVDCLGSSTFNDFQTVYKGEIWCLCTVTFGQKSSKLNSRPIYCSRPYGTWKLLYIPHLVCIFYSAQKQMITFLYESLSTLEVLSKIPFKLT